MIYLTVGYWLGGGWPTAIRAPRVLYGITAVAGFAVGLIPVLLAPILSWSLDGFNSYSVGIFYGSLVGVIILFSVPLILLGFVSPFAIRLRSLNVTHAGGTAGGVSALSTLGSILGTFIPVFFLIPNIGTAATLYAASVTVLSSRCRVCWSRASHARPQFTRACSWSCWACAFFDPQGLIRPSLSRPADLRERVGLQLHPGGARRHVVSR